MQLPKSESWILLPSTASPHGQHSCLLLLACYALLTLAACPMPGRHRSHRGGDSEFRDSVRLKRDRSIRVPGITTWLGLDTWLRFVWQISPLLLIMSRPLPGRRGGDGGERLFRDEQGREGSWVKQAPNFY